MNAKTLRRFEYLWERQPLFLINLQGVPDPRRDPDSARRAARSMIVHHIGT